MNREKLQAYAELVLKLGINIQEGQILVVSAFTQAKDFVELIVENAYKLGAKYVIVDYADVSTERIRLKNSKEEYLDNYPQLLADYRLKLLEAGASFMRIAGDDPDALKDIDPKMISRSNLAKMKASREYMEKMSRNENRWTVIAYPSQKWANKVFPELPAEKRCEKLTDVITDILRINAENGAIDAWQEFSSNIEKRMSFLNEKQFSQILFKSDKTDLKVDLPKNHIWCGGGDVSKDGVKYMPNIPTEEVFTLPQKTGVNGYVSSTKPLIYSGNEITDFKLFFENGKIVRVEAKKGKDLLEQLVDTDEGSHYLGEVALVSHSSPISKSGILFYNTLFDENASCHLAIGRAYSTNIVNGENMSPEEFADAGGNTSLVHVDFMIGSDSMDVYGVGQNGEIEELLASGEWKI